MPILDPIAFQGSFSNGTDEVAASFRAGIDDDGNLILTVDPISPARAALFLAPTGEPLRDMATLSLHGASEDGWRFASDTVHILRWSHPEGRVEIRADCGLAEISRNAHPGHRDMRAWFFRKLAAIHGIERQTPLGRLVLRGYREGADQQPISVLAIHAKSQEEADWWDESERFLIHLERILSFACDVYLVPIYEQRVRGGVMTYTLVQRGRTARPYMQPFDLLYMEQIFGCAIRTFEERSETVERLDPAIRWLTASVAYQESRLINAMSALESILERSDLPKLFLEDESAFKALRKKVQALLKNEKAPGRMGGKVGELNRRSFRDKLEYLIAARAIPTGDFPEGWLTAIIEARNTIVHTGVAPDLPADARLLDRIVWAREIVTRIILDALGFEGQYQSWLHRSAYLRFPGCQPVQEAQPDLSDGT
jgi:hypothetical protein